MGAAHLIATDLFCRAFSGSRRLKALPPFLQVRKTDGGLLRLPLYINLFLTRFGHWHAL